MGRFLGLERIASEVKEIGGIGGFIAARFAVVPMKIEEYRFDCTIAWRRLNVLLFYWVGRISLNVLI